MTEEANADELVDPMRDAFAQNIRDTVRELPAHQALQLADNLCLIWLDQLSGMRVTYRLKPMPNGHAIAEDWAKGVHISEIMKKHKCSRATAYRYHPNKNNRLSRTG